MAFLFIAGTTIAMSLYRKIEKQIESAAREFCAQVARRYELDEAELLGLWKDTASRGREKKGNRKASGFQAFSKITRAALRAEDPTLSFGNISAEIGRRWRALSAEEKAAYEPPAVEVVEKEASDASATPAGASPSLVAPSSLPKFEDEETMMDTSITTPPKPASIAETASSSSANHKRPKILRKKKKSPSAAASSESVETAAVEPAGDEYAGLSIKDLKRLCKEKGLVAKGLHKKEEFVALLTRAAPTSLEKDDTAGASASPDLSSPGAAASVGKTLEDDFDEADLLA